MIVNIIKIHKKKRRGSLSNKNKLNVTQYFTYTNEKIEKQKEKRRAIKVIKIIKNKHKLHPLQ